MTKFGIFISSPSDVRFERKQAKSVIERLGKEFGDLELHAYFWEFQPQEAAKAPQASIREAATCDVVIGILWSRLGTPLGDPYRRDDGTLFESGTAYELETALDASRRTKRPHVLVYRNTQPVTIPAEPPEKRQEAGEQYDRLEAFFAKHFRDSDGRWKGGYKLYDTIEQFDTLLDDDLTALIHEHFGDNVSHSGKRAWPGSPFRGLDIFDREHEEIFFGRTGRVHEVLVRLWRQNKRGVPFVLVLGMSGSGKSSLVRAGVLPALAEPKAVGNVDFWYVAIMRPRDARDPIDSLATALANATAMTRDEVDGGEADDDAGFEDGTAPNVTRREAADENFPPLPPDVLSAQRLRSNSDMVVGAILQALGQAGERQLSKLRARLERRIAELEKGGRSVDAEALRGELKSMPAPKVGLVLVIDQMEELFDDQTTPEQRNGFMVAVDVLVRARAVHVLATMRSDFYARCHELPRLEELKADNGQYDLAWPTAAEIGQMIRYPARVARLRFEDALVPDPTSDPALPNPGPDHAAEEKQDPDRSQSLDDRLLNDALVSRESLPLLEFVLDALFDNMTDERVLTHDAYEKLGRLEGAIAQKADEVWNHLDAAARSTSDKVFAALVQIAEGGEYRRKYCSAAFLNEDPKREELVDAFVNARLFVTAAGGADEPEGRITLAHETLIKHFKPLREWVTRNSEMLRIRARIAAGASLWKEKCRSRDDLIQSGRPLNDAKALKSAGWIDLNGDEKEFIDQSLAAEAARLRDLEQAVRLERRRRLIRRGLMIALVVISVIVAGREWRNRIDRQTKEALFLARTADAQREHDPVASLESARRAAAVDSAIGGGELRRSLEAANRIWALPAGSKVRAVALGHHIPVVVAGTYNGAWRSSLPPRVEDAFAADEPVEGIAVSPDDSLVLTAGPNAVRLWRNGEQVDLGVPQDIVASFRAVYSADGKAVASADGDQVRVWISTDGSWIPTSIRELGPLKAPSGYFNSVAFSPSGDLLATAGTDESVRLWETATGRQLSVFGGHKGAVLDVAFSPDGSAVASGGSDSTVRIWRTVGRWEPETMRNYAIRGHTGAVSKIAYSPRGRFIASAGTDGTARIWEASSGELVSRLAGHPGPVRSLAFGLDGRMVATASDDHIVRVWRTDTQRHPLPHGAAVTNATFSPEGDFVLTAGLDGIVKAWFSATGEAAAVLRHRPGVVDASDLKDLAVEPTHGRVVAGGEDGNVKIWDGRTCEPLTQVAAHRGSVESVAFTNTGQLMTAGADGEVHWWDTGAWQQSAGTLSHGSPIYRAALSPDGAIVATAGASGSVQLWDAKSKTAMRRLTGLSGAVYDAAFSADGTLLVAAGKGEAVRIWTVASGEQVWELPKEKSAERAIVSARFSPVSNDVVVTADEMGKTSVWSVKANAVTAELSTHAGLVRLAIRGDGRAILTASGDGTARIEGWFAFAPIDDLLTAVPTLSFSENGKSALFSACPRPE